MGPTTSRSNAHLTNLLVATAIVGGVFVLGLFAVHSKQRRKNEHWVDHITLAQRLASGILQCRVDRGGDLPPSSTKLVPPTLSQVEHFYRPKAEEWLEDPTFACAHFAPTDAPGWRVTWHRAGPQAGSVLVRDYRNAQTATAIITCGEEGCLVKGEPGFTADDPGWGKVRPKTYGDPPPPVHSGPVGSEVLSRPTLDAIRVENAPLVEELTGVETIATKPKLAFSDGTPVGFWQPLIEPFPGTATERGGMRDVASSPFIVAELDANGDVLLSRDKSPKVKRSCGPTATRVGLTRDGRYLYCGSTRVEHVFAVRKSVRRPHIAD